MKKYLTAILSALLLTATLVSCGGSPSGGTADTTAAGGANDSANEVTTEAEETRIPSGLPDDFDLDGYVMTYYGAKIEPDKNNSERGVYASEQNGDLINDAAFVRNSLVMEKYNCVIEFTECSGSHPIDTVKAVILAGDDAYDAILEGAGNMPALASEGMLVDLESLEYMDMSAPWWLQSVNDTLHIGDRLYCTIGSHMIRTKTFLYTVFFNHKIAADYGIDKNDLYSAARNGTWTLEMLYDNARKVKADLNGDGLYDSNDLWGCSGEAYCAYSLTYGCDVDFIAYEDDVPHLTLNNEANIRVMQDVIELMTDEETMLVTNRITGVSDVWETRSQMLVNDQYFFFLGQPGYERVRVMESDFGVLPSPKYTEQQKDYRHTTTVYNGTTLMIPISAADVEKVGFIQEALSYESYYSFLPAFYENYVETKYARDQESVEMLQLIHNSIYYDMGGILASDYCINILNNIASTGKGADTLVSQLATKEAASNEKILKTVSAILGN